MPVGARAHFRGGGDIAIATSVGLVPLSKAISLDVTSLNVATVSYKIADAWSEAVTSRGMDERSEEHTSELQSLMRISYAVFCLKKKKKHLILTITNRDLHVQLLSTVT